MTTPKYGIITWIVEKSFYLMKFLPPQVFYEERIKHQDRLSKLNEEEKKLAIIKRTKSIDVIIFFYIILYIISIICNDFIVSYEWIKWIVLVLVVLRYIDILQVNVNITVFDSLRAGQGNNADNKLASLIRSIVFVSYNFIEIIIIFGLTYSFFPDMILTTNKCVELNFWDNIYFSIITQLTVGYGDINPIGFGKIIVSIQVLTGYFFTILIISRLLSSLPKIDSLNK